MKAIYLFLLIFWMLFTIVLICSIVGMLFLAPVPNDTSYYRPMTDDRRSTWMLIGLKTLNKLLED
jgi:hypothetical protein